MKKNLLKAVQLFIMLLLVNSVSAQLTRLKTSGQNIVNAAGDNVLLRGVNVGGWLVQEGYIVSPSGGGPGAGTQGDMKRKLYGLGYTDAQVEDFYQKWRDNYITKPDVDYIASKGFNCIRIPLHYELFLTSAQRAVRNTVVKNNNSTSSLNTYIQSLATWYNNNELMTDPANLEGIKAIDRLLGWCATNNLYVIIDLHAAPGGQGEDANIADPLLRNDLWNRTYNGKKIYQDIVVKIWQTIAARYKDNNTVAMYDLINEPNSVPGGAATIFDVLNRSINAIRALGDTHMILIEGDGFGNEMGNSIKPNNFNNKTNLVYNSHRYGDQYVGPAVDYNTDANPTNTNKTGNMIIFKQQNNVPTWVGETGENSPNWVSANVDRLVGENIGYAYWTYKRFNNNETNTIRHIPGPFLTDANPDLNQIIEHVKFAASIENPSQMECVSPNFKGQRKTAPIGSVIWIKGNNNQYLSTQSSTNIRFNKTALGDYEKFTVVDAGDGKVALKSFNNTYISSENGTKAITSTRTAFSGWEAFEWWEFKDGGIALRGFNKKFMSSENGQDSVHCNRESSNINSWEKFTWGLVTAVAKPVVSSNATADAAVGTAFTYTITASNTPTSFSATGMPAGLAVNTSTGIISGTPTEAGTFNITIGATNAGGTGTKTLALTITSERTGNPSFKVVAYVPNWIDLNTFSKSIDYSKITHINIAFENPTNAAGDLSYNNQNDILINAAHAKGVKVFMSIGGGAASGDATLLARYSDLISAAKRDAFSAKLAAYIVAHNLDGLDVDLEGPNITSDYGAFIAALGPVIHAQGKSLSAALSQGYGGANVPSSTFTHFDFINIMAYDGAGPWDQNNPGQHSSYAYAQNNTTYWLNRGLPKSKAVLGLPFYGYGFGAAFSNEAYAYNTITAKYAGAENVDQIGSTIWYNGIPTIKAKTNYALDQGIAGVMIWSLDNDATGAKSLLSALYEAIVAKVGSGPVLAITSPISGTGFKDGDNVTITATATDADGISKVEFFNGATKLGEDLNSPYSYSWTAGAAGTYTITAKATDSKGNSTSTSVNIGVQGAYNNAIAVIPGKIEAENYDLGGPGVAYNDIEEENKGGAYRLTEGVDIEACTDAGGGYNVGYTGATEWMEYTVNVTANGVYKIEARVASTAAGNTFHLELDGTNISGAITVPNTGGWQTFLTASATTPTLKTGHYTLRVVLENGGFNLNSINFTAVAGVPVVSSSSSSAATIGKAFSYSITASNTPTSFDATGLPDGLTVNKSTGNISGTPTKAGQFSVVTSATNASGTGTKTITINVKDVAPVITSSLNVSGTRGVAFSYTIAASNTPTGYDATGLPLGISINKTTGIITGTPRTIGSYAVAISATNSGGTITETLQLTIDNSAGAPYQGSVWAIPGKIEAENYDNGGQGIAYNDIDAVNNGGQYRTTERVDVEACTDAGAGYNVGWFEVGEWMDYSVDVKMDGIYTLEARVASGVAGPKSLHVELNGENISGSIAFSTNGGWQTWQTVTVKTKALTAGKKIMRVVVDEVGFNINNLTFTADIATGIKSEDSFISNLYPNPVNAGENIQISFAEKITGPFEVSLYNFLGQTIDKSFVDVIDGKATYQIQDMPVGYYLLEITQKGGYKSKYKIAVQ